MRRLVRFCLLTIGLWIAETIGQTWGGNGAFSYPEARWNGRVYIYTGRMITVCDWRCYVGLDPPTRR